MEEKRCFVSDLIRALESLAPARLAEAWDCVGLQVGHPAAPIRRVMTCLEITPPILAEASRRKVDALVSHHPLMFHPLSTINLAQPTASLAAEVIRMGITVVAAHTNLDAAAWGTNQALAEACGLTAEGPLATREGDEAYGLGLIARLEAPVSSDEWAETIKHRLNLKQIRLSGPVRKKVRRVAVCTGSGGSLLGKAAARADAYLTGELDYHRAVEAHQRALPVLEIGHFESEVLVAAPLADRLGQTPTLREADVEVFPACDDLQPFRYR